MTKIVLFFSVFECIVQILIYCYALPRLAAPYKIPYKIRFLTPVFRQDLSFCASFAAAKNKKRLTPF